ncbi:MAG: SBBP repeat-containing protein [Anaerolineae bacterium]|nr:SBBP repeat-containing protein [Anaerolineae bacterium]
MLSSQSMQTKQLNNGLRRLILALLALGVVWLGLMLASIMKVSRSALNTTQLQMTTQSLSFVANAGQADPAVQFQLHRDGQTLYFTADEIQFVTTQSKDEILISDIVRLSFAGANDDPDVQGLDPLPGIANFFRGSDPAGWQTNVPTYGGIIYTDLYPGIDLVYRGTEGQLKSEFLVAPGADPTQIKMTYHGVEQTSLRSDGALALRSPHSELVETTPVVYQEIGGQRVPVEARYVLLENHQVGFELGQYNAVYPLVIDPTLGFSSYLGGNKVDIAWDVTVDKNGNVYVVGETDSDNFVTKNPFQSNFKGTKDAFVAKFNPNGTRLYTTYLGGNNLDVAYGIVVDNSGNAYVTGQASINTGGVDPFPTTSGAYQTTITGGYSAFVTKLNPNGNGLVYSTFLGGSAAGTDIALDSSGYAYIIGRTASTSFPLKNPFQNSYGGGLQDAFVTKFNQNGTDLVYSTYLGGDDREISGFKEGGIAVDSAGHAYVTGYTWSDDFPTTSGAFDTTLSGGSSQPEDAFVTKLSVDGGSLVYSTYLGGNEPILTDRGQDIAVDAAGRAYVIGTTSAEDFPTRNAFQSERNGNYIDAFITKLNAAGNDLIFSTYLGGSFTDYGYGIALDDDANIYVTGQTSSSDFPTKRPLQDELNAFQPDVFIAKLPANGASLIYSTYLGGANSDEGRAIAAFGSGDEAVAYVVGKAKDTFPVQNAAQSTYGGDVSDGFITKISDPASNTTNFGVYLPLVIK